MKGTYISDHTIYIYIYMFFLKTSIKDKTKEKRYSSIDSPHAGAEQKTSPANPRTCGQLTQVVNSAHVSRIIAETTYIIYIWQ